MLLKLLNAVHLSTMWAVFVAWLGTSFVIYYNGTPIDFTTTQGRLSFVTALIMAVVTVLQKVTPATTK